MVLKITLALVVSFAISVTIASAGGPDITSRPAKAKPASMIEPLNRGASAIKSAVKKIKVKKLPSGFVSEAYADDASGVEHGTYPMQPCNSRQMVVADRTPTAPKAVVDDRVNVLFESEPANAELIINGLYVGSTPAQVPLKSGTYNVRMISEGSPAWERQVKAYRGLRVFAVLAGKPTPEQ